VAPKDPLAHQALAVLRIAAQIAQRVDLSCDPQYGCGMTEKTDVIQVRMSADEKLSFERAAEVGGVSLSAWVRNRLRAAALNELQGAGLKVPFVEALRARQ
jgi:hypothetical protein